MHWFSGFFLLVLIVSTSSEFLFLKKERYERNNIVQGLAKERHRRGLYEFGKGNDEFLFFLRYFQAKGRENIFRESIHHGRINNWAPVFGHPGSMTYNGAIRTVVSYYLNHNIASEKAYMIERIRGIIAFRIIQNNKYDPLPPATPDPNHQRALQLWKDELQILDPNPILG